ncbi:unnamed protein product [Ilex paraguariensis]|uniref:Uncharacterized protein n=1 Tax=Ilex paraguariensis TaxID=185542 RepID=A0ABC8RT79_9AQUA
MRFVRSWPSLCWLKNGFIRHYLNCMDMEMTHKFDATRGYFTTYTPTECDASSLNPAQIRISHSKECVFSCLEAFACRKIKLSFDGSFLGKRAHVIYGVMVKLENPLMLMVTVSVWPDHNIEMNPLCLLLLMIYLVVKEEKLKDKPGYEHLNEPLHVLVEAELPEDIIESRLDHAVALLENLLKPMDESMDIYKKQQLRELALLNGTLREESPCMSPSMSPSMSPFNSTGMKRAKTGR